VQDFFLSLMTDRRNGAVYAPIKCVLYVLSLAYGLGLFARRLLYALRIFRSEKVPMKIVSIGNLTLGGTGKTPFVIALAGIVRRELKREPCVLIRGYGWDEQAMLKKNLPDTPILVGEDRVKQAYRAIKLYGSSMGILDDGFQYWELGRDLNIVLVDSRWPFGNNRLFPRGVLREPVQALKRADIVVFTKIGDKASGLDGLKDSMRNINRSLVFLEAAHKPVYFYDAKARKELPLASVSGKKVILISAIGDPAYFEETMNALGAVIVEHMAFGDHHEYDPRDIGRIKNLCNERAFDYIVTTEKDAVKFTRKSIFFGKHILLTLAIEMDITAGKEILIDRLRSVLRG
jgi:tetraacyldisaccharide 4'-kinase